MYLSFPHTTFLCHGLHPNSFFFFFSAMKFIFAFGVLAQLLGEEKNKSTWLS